MTEQISKEELLTRFFEMMQEKDVLLCKLKLGELTSDESERLVRLVAEQNELIGRMIDMKIIDIQVTED